MLSEPIHDSRAWRCGPDAELDAKIRLSTELIDAFETCVGDRQTAPTDCELNPSVLKQWREARQIVSDMIESGVGYVILDGLPLERYSIRQAQAVYWLVGRCLGEPFEQNIQGTLLYDVRDMGHNVAEGARFSVTNTESSFHTDNAFGPRIPDIVGLLCLKTAHSGGRSQLVSAYTLHSELLRRHPHVLATLYESFCFDRRGQVERGEDEYSRHPVFHWDGVGLTTRYLDYYIRVGHDKARQPLTTAQHEALDVVIRLLAVPDFRVEFDLQPGQMLFTNNHWILHNRTAFRDVADPSRRRHYVRLWLNRTRQTVVAGRPGAS